MSNTFKMCFFLTHHFTFICNFYSCQSINHWESNMFWHIHLFKDALIFWTRVNYSTLIKDDESKAHRFQLHQKGLQEIINGMTIGHRSEAAIAANRVHPQYNISLHFFFHIISPAHSLTKLHQVQDVSAWAWLRKSGLCFGQSVFSATTLQQKGPKKLNPGQQFCIYF